MKGHKRKKNKEKYNREEEEEEEQVEEEPSSETGKRAKLDNISEIDDKEGEAEEAVVHEMEGIPIAPSEQNTKKPGVIFILEKASLEVAKVGKVLICINILIDLYLCTYTHDFRR